VGIAISILVGSTLTDEFFLVWQLYRQRGKEGVPRDSKFTGRKRRTVF
jgi:hypothetical protein